MGSTGQAFRLSPNGVVHYSFDASFAGVNRNFVRTVMNTMERDLGGFQKDCIRFVEDDTASARIDIQSNGGCWSVVGRTGAVQGLSLSDPGCVHTGTVQHELLHAMGFHHEQARPDRDSHVEIKWQNISPGKERNFVITDTIDSRGSA